MALINLGTLKIRLRGRCTPLLATAGLLAAGFAGCEKQEEIRVYTVAKSPPIEQKPSAAAPSSSDFRGEVEERIPDRQFSQTSASGGSSPGRPTEMLGAITPQGKATWFFKLTGPVKAVAEAKKPFARFINSVKFGGNGPEWELPEGWKAEPGSQMRFATIRIDSADGPLEMSVIPLPTGEGDFEPYLLANVNRWRGQVGLPALSPAQLAESKEIFKSDLNGSPIWFTDFVGESQPDSMGGPPGGKAAMPREKPAKTDVASVLPFDCQVPVEWTPGEAGQFQKAVFDVRDGNRQASITVSTAGGDRADNINRWRGQVGLESVSAGEIARESRKITIDGHEGVIVEAVGPESSKSREMIVGAIVEVRGQQWFIKLKGDADLASREKSRFEAFVQSIRFR